MKTYSIHHKKEIDINDVVNVAKGEVHVSLSKEVRSALKKSRQIVEEKVDSGEAVYGINTGFGELKYQAIDKEHVEQLQRNLIRSHAVGVGEFLTKEQSRAVLFIRLISLCRGYSGIRVVLAEKIAELLNKDMIPVIPSQGSVGCSGDLAPLSHAALVLMGEGMVWQDGKPVATKKAFQKYNIEAITLQEKEGLALNNGTAVMTAIAALSIYRAERVLDAIDAAGAISLEVLMGTLTAFDPRIQKVRGHDGQKKVSERFMELCKNSEIMDSHKDCDRIQDAYSLRCIPQVHGAVHDVVQYAKSRIETELNSVTDNPILFSEDKTVLSGGNFHGEPVALTMDFLSIALADIGNISERRVFRMLTPALNEGLPPFLIGSEKVGVNSGFMILQYTAASLTAENKTYAGPVSVDSIPTSADQEDHVSFGTIASRKNQKIVENLEKIAAIELICAAQAADHRAPLKLGKGTKKVYKKIREKVYFVKGDRSLSKDIEIVADLIKEGVLED